MNIKLKPFYKVICSIIVLFMALQIGRSWGQHENATSAEVWHIPPAENLHAAELAEKKIETYPLELTKLFWDTLPSQEKIKSIEPPKEKTKNPTEAERLYIPFEIVDLGKFTITAYCAENYSHICNDGDATRTATGTRPQPGRTIAIDPNIIPYGTYIYVDGMGLYIAEDCGGAIKNNRADILFATHAEALIFGRQALNVWIISPLTNDADMIK